MDNLTTLANRFGSDKGTGVGRPPHRYTFLYDLLFHELRDRPIALAEIGLAIGGPELGGPVDRQVASPSAAMWLAYFPQAQVFGFDISDFAHLEGPRFTFIRGDSGVEADLRRLAEAAAGFDMIIDDGSHASYHQQLALRTLFPRLRPGGLYIIEDLHWQSPQYEAALPQVPRTADFLHHFLVNDIYIENRLFSRADVTHLRNRLDSFALFPDFSGVPGRGGIKLAALRAGPNGGEAAG